MNQVERNIPLLASPQGGVAERSTRCCEASADSEDGVVFRLNSNRSGDRKTTPSASASVAARNFLMTQPPLLAVMQGGEYIALDADSFTPFTWSLRQNAVIPQSRASR